MSKYRFRLETLEKLRIAQRDQHRAALADGYHAEQILTDQRAALAAEAAALRESQRVVLASPRLDVNQLVEAQRYDMVLHAQQQQLKDQAARLAVEVERRRLAVVEADRAVRVLDKLDERRRAEHRKQQERLEHRLLDEVASTRHRRK
ncbi:MAG: flagellar FliJ family protein [Pirellulales bacterium]